MRVVVPTFAGLVAFVALSAQAAPLGPPQPSATELGAAAPIELARDGCGYGYYRTNTTTSSGKKIYYYRCLGSDDYRYEGGRVCSNKPVRADYLDTVVWDHITGLLADPSLIRAEIDKRLAQARTADPAIRQRQLLELALAKATTAITRMIEAFSEQLITIRSNRS